jgi:hypothetical protein
VNRSPICLPSAWYTFNHDPSVNVTILHVPRTSGSAC